MVGCHTSFQRVMLILCFAMAACGGDVAESVGKTCAALDGTGVPAEHGICTSCHRLHVESSYPSLLERLCQECHVEGGPATAVATHSSRTTATTYGNWDLDCWSCHEPHKQSQNEAYGTTYGKLLRVNLAAEIKLIDPAGGGPYWPPLSISRTVASSDIRLTSTAEYVDGDASSTDDICQVCHEVTNNYGTGLAFNNHSQFGADAQPGGKCTNCHLHSNGFRSLGCTECHDQVQGSRRQIVGPGGDFEMASKHLPGPVTDDNCRVCHDMSKHTRGLVKLNDPDTGTPLAGTLTAFCLACHDGSPAAGWTFPGTASGSGYNKSTFAGSTHDTQLGGAGCMHCHNGHGSSYASLLKLQYVTTDYNQWSQGDGDYALCWKCHPEGNTVMGDNAFDDRHDKHVRSEDSPCYICHDVHASYDAGEPGLINLDLAVQQGYDSSYLNGSNGSTSYWKSGSRGYCEINCHGKEHDPKDYDPRGNPSTHCSNCHSQGNGYSHDPTPINCEYCHSSTRPALPHPDSGDCSTCHFDPGSTWLGALYDHSPTPLSCASCHETARPVSPHEQVLDCVECHFDPGVTWQGATYSHDPVPISCAACHESDRPVLPHNQTMDCVECHSSPGVTWVGGNYGHLPTPTACATCHETTRPVLPHNQTMDCANCHGDVGGAWANSITVYDHTPTPTACASCHEPNRPATSHITGGDCASCHSNPGGVWTGAVAGDCITCHDQSQGSRPQIVGIGGQFQMTSDHANGTVTSAMCLNCHYVKNHSLGIVELANPDDFSLWAGTQTAFCITCHDGTPPAGVVFSTATGTGYDKSTFVGSTHDQQFGGAACSHCHNGHGSNNASLLKQRYVKTDFNQWSQGDGDYALCWNCHPESSIVTGNNAFNDLHDKHVRSEDSPCYICHDVHASADAGEAGLINFSAPVQQSYNINYSGGTNASSSFYKSGSTGYCRVSCHGRGHSPESYQPLSSPATTCASCHSQGGGFSHSPTPLACEHCHTADRPVPPHPASGDCSTCHFAAGSTWLGATFDHNPVPTTCEACHVSDRPALNHDPTMDCVGCHTNPGVSWLGATVSHAPAPTACKNCHATSRPTVNHDPTVDCVGCHTNAGVSWLGATVSHSPAPASCADCHETTRPIAPHEQSLDCLDCHVANAGVTWLGAAYNHTPTPTECASCHSGDRPIAPHEQAIDCVECHTAPGVSWLTVSYSHSPPPTTCAGCHEGTRPATGHITSGECATCHSDPGGVWTGAVGGDCTSCHNQVQGTRPQIVGAGGEFQMASNHWAGTITSADCLNCHYVANHSLGTVELSNPDSISTVWAGTKTAFCLTCHDGTPPAGITFPTAGGTGYNKTGYTGSSHDGQLVQQGCLHCHKAHGSANGSLLSLKYVVTDNNQWTQGDGDYALCWQCHSESNVVMGNNVFEDFHDTHVRGDNSPCIICHDVHAGTDAGEPGLINMGYPISAGGYDISYIGGRNASTAFWTSGGNGFCYIMCHGKDHTPKDYNQGSATSTSCTPCH
jgi:hypothetical protein